MVELAKFTNFITKGMNIEKDGDERTFTGYITAEVVDRQNEIIAIDQVMKIMDRFMKTNPVISDMHTNRVSGIVKDYKLDEIEGHPAIKITGMIYKVDGVQLYDNVWDKIKKHEYTGLSMGGASHTKIPEVRDGQLIMKLEDIELYEIALCPTPANQLAIIDHVNMFAKLLPDKQILKDMDGRMIIKCDSVACVIEHIDKATGTNLDLDKDVQNISSDGAQDTTGGNPNLKVKLDNLGKSIIELGKTYEEMLKPFAGYKDFAECEAKNKDKGDTGAYCGSIQAKVEGTKKSADEINFKYPLLTKDNMSEQPKVETITPAATVAPQVDIFGSVLKIIAEQSETTKTLSKAIDEIKTSLKKLEDANPVQHGVTLEATPKVQDSLDAGARVEATNAYGHSQQASIIAPAVPRLDGKDEAKEEDEVNKADEHKADCDCAECIKKSSVAKAEEEKKKEEEKKEVEKQSSNTQVYKYQVVNPVRPAIIQKSHESTPTGYQILKAIGSGWNGKFKDANASIEEAYIKLLDGSLGTGQPEGSV